MSRVIEKTIYQFSELSDKAKERARDWYRGCIESDELTDYDYWTAIADVLGIKFDQRKGSSKPCVWWSGFASQCDGACFEGHYTYATGSRKAIREYAPRNTVLHGIADDLASIQRRYFYQIEAKITHNGHYYHSGMMDIDVYSPTSEYFRSYPASFDDIKQPLRDFADWIYKQLNAQNDYLNSDENIDECIEINEYEFDENGERI